MDTYQDSFIYLGGRHGYNVANWLTSQVGQPGVWLILLVTAICFLIYVSARTVIWLRKLFTLSFLKRTKRKRQKKINRLLPINSRNRNLSIQNLMKWNSLWTGLSAGTCFERDKGERAGGTGTGCAGTGICCSGEYGA